MTNTTSTHHHHQHRRASFDITSLLYYSRHCQHHLPLLTTNNTNKASIAKRQRRNSVHELPSQLEYQMDLKLSRRLKCMRREAAAALIASTANDDDAKITAKTTAANGGAAKADETYYCTDEKNTVENHGVNEPTTSGDIVQIELIHNNNNDAIGDAIVVEDDVGSIDDGVVVNRNNGVVKKEEEQLSSKGGEFQVVDVTTTTADAIETHQQQQQQEQEQQVTLQQFTTLQEANFNKRHNENEDEEDGDDEDDSTASYDWKELSILQQIRTTAVTTMTADCSDEDTLPIRNCSDSQLADVDNIDNGMERWDEIDHHREGSNKVTQHDDDVVVDTTSTTTTNDDIGQERIIEVQSSNSSVSSSEGSGNDDEEDAMNYVGLVEDDEGSLLDHHHQEERIISMKEVGELSPTTTREAIITNERQHGLILPMMVVGEEGVEKIMKKGDDNIGVVGLIEGDYGESSSNVRVNDNGGRASGEISGGGDCDNNIMTTSSSSSTANVNTSNINTATNTVATAAAESNAASSSTTATTTIHSNSNASYNNNNDDKMDILTEGQYFLSISMLVYMYAHLRETCRMGHTRVKMEEIDCNTSSSSSSNWSSSSCRRRPGRICSFSSLGGSSMHSMVSMMSSSLQQQQKQQSWQQQQQQQQHHQPSCDLSNNSNNALTAGSIIRIVIDELEDYDKEHTTNNTNTTNDYYYYQAANTLHHREYEESVMKEFRQWIEQSRVSQLDSNTQDLIASMRKKASSARWKRAMNVMRMTSRLQSSFIINNNGGGGGGGDRVVGTTQNPNEEQMIHYLRRQVAKYRWKRAIFKVRLAVKLNGGKAPNFDFSMGDDDDDDGVEGNENQYVSMNNLLQRALEKAPKYFTEGSVMSNLIESNLEVVWLADFTQNDVVYGICVQREEKKITVVFRGTVNAHNWSMNLRYDMMEIPNPLVDEYYPGRAETLNLHSGFALYLLRRRKDTRRSKMDEIFEKIQQIGNELDPDGDGDYKICITGHSMGGALATLFGFFLGAKLRQSSSRQQQQQHDKKNQELQVYTFASPRVGGESFLYAYQHLERAGLIRHARFSCTNDIVPLIPFCNFEPNNLKFYKHVGMRVQLHNTGPIGKWRLRKRLDVSYPLCHDWSSTVARGLMNCIFANPNSLRGYKMYHTLTEYQTRLHFALTYRKALRSTVYFLDERRQRLKSLDEYYAFRGTMNIDVYSYVYLIPSTDGFNVRKSLTKVFLVIPLMYVWTRLLSTVTSAEIIIPKVAHWVLVEQVPKVVVAIPFLLILENLLKLSFGLAVMIEVIKMAIKIPHRWGRRFKKMSGRLMLVAPLLNIWVKYVVRLTNVVIPKNAHRLILKHLSMSAHRLVLKHLFNLRELVPFFATLVYKLLQLSFGLSFVVVALGISMRARSNRWRSLGRVFIATLMLVAWVFLFSAACKHMTSDVTTAKVSNSNKPGWGLTIERNAEISNNLHRLIPRQMYGAMRKNVHLLIPQQMFSLRNLVTFITGPIYYLLRLSFGLSFVVVALGSSLRARSNRWRRSLGRVFIATLMLVALVFLFSAAYKNMVSDLTTAGVSNSNKPGWGLPIDNTHTMGHVDNSSSVLNEDNMSNIDATTTESKLASIQEQLSPIQDYATGIEFAPILDNGLYLVGAGVRKKSVIKVYAVAMYSTPKVLSSANTHVSLLDAARSFDSTSTMTSFVLEMVYSAGAEKIAGAIAESVKPRYDGAPSDIVTLESLIVDGVNAIGGQAVRGTTFRFDCYKEGVSVSVNGVEQGVAAFDGLGSAFVDVFMDGNSVSPTLKDSCVSAWSTDDSRSTAESLIELSTLVGGADLQGSTENKPDKAAIRRDVEAQLKPIQEYATSIVFDPKLDEGLYLIGAGVRKKSVVKVYAVAFYGSASVLKSASTPTALRTAARTFNASTPLTSFVLEMVYSASAEKIGGAIADSVKPRYNGPAADIDTLESLIVEGVNSKGGRATKGTTFRFDCSQEGVTVTVDGSVQGTAKFANIGSAFVDVFLDDNAVSPTLVSNCMDTWSNPEAEAIAASLLELDELEDDESTVEQISGEEETDEGLSREEVESQLSPIQDYATGIEFAPILDNGLYLVGAGVRKKSVIKVYAVAMYSTPKVLSSTDSHASLRDAARSFDSTSTMTSFVLEMVYSAGAEKIAGAIAESVKPRYDGAPSDIVTLESLIVDGVNAIGGQAVRGTTFRFDCFKEGVRVIVNGAVQGVAAIDGLGSAFVDVFMDGNSVSPTLKDSCVSAWSSEDARLMATELLKLDDKIHPKGIDDVNMDSTEDEDDEEEVEVGSDNATATNITAATVSSIEFEINDRVDILKIKTPTKPKHNLLRKAVKFAFPVF